jgi:hypothetical protein
MFLLGYYEAFHMAEFPASTTVPFLETCNSCNSFLLFVHVFLLLSMYTYCCLCTLILVYVFLLFVHVFLTLSMYSYCCLCILIVVYVYLFLSVYSYCLCILIVRPCILNVVYIFLLFVHVFLFLSMYPYCCLCILIVVYVFLLLSMYSYCSSMYS